MMGDGVMDVVFSRGKAVPVAESRGSGKKEEVAGRSGQREMVTRFVYASNGTERSQGQYTRWMLWSRVGRVGS